MIRWLEITLSFWKDVLDQSLKSFNTKFGHQSKYQETSYQLIPILAVFLQINCVKTVLKALELPKLLNKSILKEPGQGRGKKQCAEIIIVKIFETSSGFNV